MGMAFVLFAAVGLGHPDLPFPQKMELLTEMSPLDGRERAKLIRPGMGQLEVDKILGTKSLFAYCHGPYAHISEEFYAESGVCVTFVYGKVSCVTPLKTRIVKRGPGNKASRKP